MVVLFGIAKYQNYFLILYGLFGLSFPSDRCKVVPFRDLRFVLGWLEEGLKMLRGFGVVLFCFVC